jgi:hypothetical protein
MVSDFDVQNICVGRTAASVHPGYKGICSNFLWGVKSTNASELYWGDCGLYVRYHTYDDS